MSKRESSQNGWRRRGFINFREPTAGRTQGYLSLPALIVPTVVSAYSVIRKDIYSLHRYGINTVYLFQLSVSPEGVFQVGKSKNHLFYLYKL
jgi:hypothetical protein